MRRKKKKFERLIDALHDVTDSLKKSSFRAAKV